MRRCSEVSGTQETPSINGGQGLCRERGNKRNIIMTAVDAKGMHANKSESLKGGGKAKIREQIGGGYSKKGKGSCKEVPRGWFLTWGEQPEGGLKEVGKEQASAGQART